MCHSRNRIYYSFGRSIIEAFPISLAHIDTRTPAVPQALGRSEVRHNLLSCNSPGWCSEHFHGETGIAVLELVASARRWRTSIRGVSVKICRSKSSRRIANLTNPQMSNISTPSKVKKWPPFALSGDLPIQGRQWTKNSLHVVSGLWSLDTLSSATFTSPCLPGPPQQ